MAKMIRGGQLSASQNPSKPLFFLLFYLYASLITTDQNVLNPFFLSWTYLFPLQHFTRSILYSAFYTHFYIVIIIFFTSMLLINSRYWRSRILVNAYWNTGRKYIDNIISCTVNNHSSLHLATIMNTKRKLLLETVAIAVIYCMFCALHFFF